MYVVRNANKAFRVFMHEIAATVYRTVTAHSFVNGIFSSFRNGQVNTPAVLP